MTTSLVHGLLLRVGRSSVKSCISARGIIAPGLAADADAMYDEVAGQIVWPDQLTNKAYLAVMVLPVAALYKTLTERGWARQDAVETVEAAFLATGAPQRRLFKLLLRTDLGRRLFLRSLRPNWLWLTPPPANQWRVTQRSGTRVTIEVTRCYRWDAFCLLGIPEIAKAACGFEEHMMNVSPHLSLTISSLATGADRCRISFERQPHNAS